MLWLVNARIAGPNPHQPFPPYQSTAALFPYRRPVSSFSAYKRLDFFCRLLSLLLLLLSLQCKPLVCLMFASKQTTLIQTATVTEPILRYCPFSFLSFPFLSISLGGSLTPYKQLVDASTLPAFRRLSLGKVSIRQSIIAHSLRAWLLLLTQVCPAKMILRANRAVSSSRWTQRSKISC